MGVGDCCGLVVPLPLGLSVVRRFDLSGQASAVFIPFKGTNKQTNKQNKKQKNQTSNINKFPRGNK